MSDKIIWNFFISLINQQMEDISVIQLILICLMAVIIINLIIFIYSRLSGCKITLARRILISMLIVYGCFMYMITLERREAGSRTGINTSLDFGSFSGDFFSIQQAIYCFLNVVFFVPLGMILSFLQKKKRVLVNFIMVTLQGFLISILIETSQLITQRGYFEITDIITNTVGATIGCILALIIMSAINHSKINDTYK